jgi:RNA polymerase sigma-70 factor (ECF subfamily)
MVAEALGRREVREAEPGSAAGERVSTADQPELSAVYEAHFRYVWRCLRSLGVHDAHLEDALQDTFMVVQRRLGEFDGSAQLRTWLYAIALRIARKYRERLRREPTSLDAARESHGRSGRAAGRAARAGARRARDPQRRPARSVRAGASGANVRA